MEKNGPRAQERSINVMVITETHRKKGDRKIEMEGFKTHYANRDRKGKKGGGVAILVKKTIPSHLWEHPSENNSRKFILVVTVARSWVVCIYIW